MMQNKVIGLTGNSGTGKTTIIQILKELDCYVIISDEISHKVLEKNSECYFDVINFFDTNVFGKNILNEDKTILDKGIMNQNKTILDKTILNEDKTINRKKIANIVFNDKDILKKYTALTHKYIIKLIIDEINVIKLKSQNYKYIIVDAPVLINTTLQKEMDEIWVVISDYQTQISRIVNRDNISVEDAKKRLDNQPDFEEFKKHTDIFIENNDDICELRKKIKLLVEPS